jgi:nucleotide-binding universal stress UspA family protein
MKILFAADGSKYTKKALAYLMAHESLLGPDGELMVLNVQPPMPPQVKTMVGAKVVADYQRDEAAKVLVPIDRFLKRHKVKYKLSSAVGVPGEQVVKAAKQFKAQMIVMGTHGHGFMGRVLMGSVAQRVTTDAEVPVLLVK